MAPELAILGVIEKAIDLAILALVTAQPELQPTPDGRDAVTTAQAELADDVITKAQALAAAIDAYNACVVLDHNVDDLPF